MLDACLGTSAPSLSLCWWESLAGSAPSPLLTNPTLRSRWGNWACSSLGLNQSGNQKAWLSHLVTVPTYFWGQTWADQGQGCLRSMSPTQADQGPWSSSFFLNLASPGPQPPGPQVCGFRGWYSAAWAQWETGGLAVGRRSCLTRLPPDILLVARAEAAFMIPWGGTRLGGMGAPTWVCMSVTQTGCRGPELVALFWGWLGRVHAEALSHQGVA